MKGLFIVLITFTANCFATDFSGFYEVPTSNILEKEYSVNPVEDVHFTADVIEFALPQEIASTQTRTIRFERDEKNSNLFRSAFGTTKCLEVEEDKVKCSVRYNKIYAQFLKSVLPETNAQLQDRQFSAHELQMRMNVADRFSGDPIGFLIIDLK